MMHRDQITLDPELERRARRKARSLGLSFTEYLLRLLMQDLNAPLAALDLGDSGGSNVARDKDALIGGSVANRGVR